MPGKNFGRALPVFRAPSFDVSFARKKAIPDRDCVKAEITAQEVIVPELYLRKVGVYLTDKTVTLAPSVFPNRCGMYICEIRDPLIQKSPSITALARYEYLY